ncbi:hypothetical protein [Profundibacter sp.]
MTERTLAELLKRQVIDGTINEIDQDELDAEDAPLSIFLVLGTREATTVDKGGWLKLFEQAHPKSTERASSISASTKGNESVEHRAQPYGLSRLIQAASNLITLEARKHSGSISRRNSSKLSASADKSAEIIGFPDPNDPFTSLSSEDIEPTAVDSGQPVEAVDELVASQSISLAAAVNTECERNEIILTDFVFVAGNVSLPVWKSDTAVPEVYVERAHLPEGASAIRLGGYQFLISENHRTSLSTIVACKFLLLESLASTDAESGRRTIEAEIQTKT